MGNRSIIRKKQRQDFLVREGWFTAEKKRIATDASARVYDRLTQPEGTMAILVDAPPPQENIQKFVQVASLLKRLSIKVPSIYASDVEKGFALIEDFGDSTFTRCLDEESVSVQTLYRSAVDLLIHLHKCSTPIHKLEFYTSKMLIQEASLFIEWYYPRIYKHPIPEPAAQEFQSILQEICAALEDASNALVLRDYHVDNLFWLPDQDALCSVGVIDFQDALWGPRMYDLVSLLEDARRDIKRETQNALLEYYFKAFPELNQEHERRAYAVLGVLRNLKIIGVFARLYFQDGKKKYVQFIPRVWRWIHQDLQHPYLKPLGNWLEKHFPISKQEVPK